MMFGAWGETDHDDSIRIIHRALDAGINFIDTADVYSGGESEEIVGKALAGGRRDQVVLATKVHGSMGDEPNERGNPRRWIMQEGENSPRRRAAGCRAGTARTGRSPSAPGRRGSPSATTCRCQPTRPSSRPPTSSPNWPSRRACH